MRPRVQCSPATGPPLPRQRLQATSTRRPPNGAFARQSPMARAVKANPSRPPPPRPSSAAASAPAPRSTPGRGGVFPPSSSAPPPCATAGPRQDAPPAPLPAAQFVGIRREGWPCAVEGWAETKRHGPFDLAKAFERLRRRPPSSPRHWPRGPEKPASMSPSKHPSFAKCRLHPHHRLGRPSPSTADINRPAAPPPGTTRPSAPILCRAPL